MAIATAQTATFDNINLSKQDQKEVDIDAQDSATFSQLAQLLLAGQLVQVKRVGDTIDAFKTLTDPKVTENLLNLNNPEKLTQIQLAQKTLNRRFTKTKARAQGYTEFAFYTFNRRITLDQHKHLDQAIKIAQHVQSLASVRTDQIKVERLISRFGLNPENALTLRTDIIEWQKKHPNQMIDQVLAGETSDLYRKQCAASGTKEDKKLGQGLNNYLSTAKTQAIEELKTSGVLGRAKETLDNVVLNDRYPVLSDEQRRQFNAYIETGRLNIVQETTTIKPPGGIATISSPVIKETPQATTTATVIPSFTETTSTPLYPLQETPTQPTVSPPQASSESVATAIHTTSEPSRPITKQPLKTTIHSPKQPLAGVKTTVPSRSLLSRLNLWQNKFNELRQKIVGKTIGKITDEIKKAAVKALTKLINKIISLVVKLATKIAVKLGLQALATVTIPVVGNAAAVLVEPVVTKAIEIGFAVATFAVVVIVCVVIVFIIFLDSGSSSSAKLFPPGVEKPLIVENNTFIPDNKISWKTFEEKYLINFQNNNTKYGWSEFEKKYLIPSKDYLSLEQK